jgi:DNA polymerase-3 subunit epsilon
MNTTVVDTETTGLGRNSRLVSICWISYADGVQIAKENNIIKPNGYCIPKVASDIHGITTSMAYRHGVPIRGVIERFIAAVSNSNILVAHNIGFDVRIIEEEIKLLNLPNPLTDIKKYCTMKEGKAVAKIEVIGKNGKVSIKSPKLRELHMFLFGEEFINQHSAEADTEACARCYFRMAELRNIETKIEDAVKVENVETADVKETAETKIEETAETANPDVEKVKETAEIKETFDVEDMPSCDVQLNESQRAFVEMELQNCKLIGVPGGGKTKCIIEKCRYLLRTGVIQSGGEFMIVMFSKSACTDFIDKSNDDIFTYRNVKTIHSLAWNILRHGFGVESPNFKGLINMAVIKLKLLGLIGLSLLRNCRFIIVDEAQDMSDEQHELVSLITNMLCIPLILVGDPNQNIFQSLPNPAIDKHLVDHEGETIILTENYRSTKQIIDFVNCFRPWQNQYPPVICATGTEGKLPYIYRAANDAKEILDHIINDIKTTTIPFEDICILGPVKLSRPGKNNTYANIGLSLFTNSFKKHGIPYVKHYTDCSDNTSARNTTREKGHINIQTGHGSKGLEYKKVIVVNFHLKTFTAMPSVSDYNGFKYLWYVILSRAMVELTIYAYTSSIIWTELKEVPKTLYESNGDIKCPIITIKHEPRPAIYNVNYFVKNLSESNIMTLMEYVPYTIEEKYIMEQVDIGECKYFTLYGHYVKLSFIINYMIHNNRLREYISEEQVKVYGTIMLDGKWQQMFNNLCKIYPSLRYEFDINLLHKIKNKVNNNNRSIVEYLLNNVKDRKHINIRINDKVRFYDIKHHIDIYNSLLDNSNLRKNIFALALFDYQYNTETRYLLHKNWTESIEDMDCHIDNIISYVPSCKEGYVFTEKNGYINLIDQVNYNTDNIILGIQYFANSVDHILSGVLSYLCKYGTINNEMKLEIINLYTGTLSIIQFNNVTPVGFIKKIESCLSGMEKSDIISINNR